MATSERAARLLLWVATAILGAGSVMHALGYAMLEPATGRSGLTPFLSGSFKALWLIDSSTMLVLAAAFAFMAARAAPASRSIVVLLALIPAATAGLIYTFVGSFVGGHINLAGAAAALTSALFIPPLTRKKELTS